MSRILLLEDDLSLITGLSFAFKKQGFEADNARTLREADSLWADGKYDLLVLDVSLPDGSGFEFCQRVRRNSKVPIIFLTASDKETSIIMGLDIGGDDYITKPFKLGVLTLVLCALLILTEGFMWLSYQSFSPWLPLLFLLAGGAVWLLCFRYFKRQNRTMEQAVTQINAYLDGDRSARIECDSELGRGTVFTVNFLNPAKL